MINVHLLPDTHYRRMTDILNCFTDEVCRDILLIMISHEVPISLTELDRLCTHYRTTIKDRLRKMVFLKVISPSLINGSREYQYFINEERLYFLNSMIYTYTTQKRSIP